MTVKDETYVFIQDVKDKKITARSARHTRTHCGKGGRVRFPSDNLSKKELQKMNGECKSYRLNDPMAWREFKTMPDDIKVTYINLLRGKYGVPDAQIANMMSVNKCSFSTEMKRLGLAVGNGVRSGTTKWDKEGFYAWWHGVDKLPTPVEEEPVPEEKEAVIIEEPEAFVDEDIPWGEPDPIPVEEYKPSPVTAVPNSGRLSFICPANQALNTIAQLLGDANVRISVSWDVIAEGGEVISG